MWVWVGSSVLNNGSGQNWPHWLYWDHLYPHLSSYLSSSSSSSNTFELSTRILLILRTSSHSHIYKQVPAAFRCHRFSDKIMVFLGPFFVVEAENNCEDWYSGGVCAQRSINRVICQTLFSTFPSFLLHSWQGRHPRRFTWEDSKGW